MPAPLATPARITCSLIERYRLCRNFLVRVSGKDGVGEFIECVRTWKRPNSPAQELRREFSPRGSCTPMIPVEDGNTRCGLTWICFATPMHTLLAAFSPCFPVAQLALPAFTISARISPCPRRRCSRPTVTGAATIWLRVNMAAAEAPSGARANAKSGLPLALMPAVQAEKRNP